MKVQINTIKEDPNNPRKIFDTKHIEGLAKSIQIEGLINEIEVDKNMVIITGACRYRAALLLGYTEIPVRVNQSGYSEYERLRHQMAENVHQSGSSYDTMMNPVDTARGYAKLLKLKLGKDVEPGSQSWFKATYGSRIVEELAQEIGIAPRTIEEFLDLLNQPDYLLEAVRRGVPRTYVREAEHAPDEIKDKIKQKIASGDYLSRDQIRQEVEVAKRIPDLALIEIDRNQAKESQQTNRILQGVAKLALAMDAKPLSEIDVREKGIIARQLDWLKDEIGKYLDGI